MHIEARDFTLFVKQILGYFFFKKDLTVERNPYKTL